MAVSINAIDRSLSHRMKKWSDPALRISFAVIFIWFGILKPIGVSAAIPMVEATVTWLPLFDAATWVDIIGYWEVAIGIAFLFKSTTRIAIALLFMQMTGTFMPLFVLPEVTFQDSLPWLPTMEGQYIIKNLMIIAAALVLGGRLRRHRKSHHQ